MKNELRDITSDTQTVSSGEKNTHIQYESCAVLLLAGLWWHVSVSVSLAIHPDKIRIATGQIAGVDKDGRVRMQTVYVSAFLTKLNQLLKDKTGSLNFVNKKYDQYLLTIFLQHEQDCN